MSRVVANNFPYLRFIPLRWIGLICALGLLSACAAPLAALGSSGTAAASTVGTAAIANPGTAASLASTAATGKSPLEHAASAATKKECSFFNVIDSKPICIEVVLPTITDNSEPLLGPADTTKQSAQQ
ncbi:hypothetical protein [Polynucleobacter sp. AP-Reno-20A-A9]|uniref:hypothetical protein n=1 Tax=Polynucleobacter sp. AP-Reno-20A-A9 TaxID=2576925 RepID=UPI001C0CD27E|nr:hypothetical protein [Polynucleobacter sp. AP-Reno-20A-A9]MBU3628905.1 hypothetical protein [Polynucleobacter sp. AP-Reno-20A-A9]